MTQENYYYQVFIKIKQENEDAKVKIVTRELLVSAVDLVDVATKVTKYMESAPIKYEWSIDKTAIKPNFEAFID